MSKGSNIQIKDVLLMVEICDVCKEDFTSHSFNFVCNTLEGGHIFYTKISNSSKYHDTEGIVKHCTNYLNYIQSKKWSWIMDFEDFGIKHTLGLNTGIQLSRLINTYGGLHHLFVINTNVFVEQMLKMIKLTLNKEYHDCIHVLRPNDELTRRILGQWQKLDEHYPLLNDLLI
jgi:hypothetical protein